MDDKVVISRGGREPSALGASPHTLTFAHDPVLLDTNSGLFFALAFHYRVLRSADRGPWRVHTAAYYFGFDDMDGREILAYHWHPENAPAVHFPHMHIGHGAVDRGLLERAGLSPAHNGLRSDLANAHLPTRRIAFEDLIRLAIEQLGVQPRRPDSDVILRRTRSLFVRERTWL